MFNPSLLSRYGWKPFFQQQLSLQEFESCQIARVSSVHQGHIECLNETGYFTLPLLASSPKLATGDWILIDEEQHISRCLQRFSQIARKSAGSQLDTQLMVTNVDTAFIVCSLNDDFSLNRIERYLALCKETDITPIVVLTKQDLCADWETLTEQVKQLDAQLAVFAVNALDKGTLKPLEYFCGTGNTLCFLGSSGVGKSTLVNSLSDKNEQATAGIREADSKGRHTTTQRHILPLEAGGVLIDTPGMRELQIVNCEEGIKQTFADVESLAQQCKFSDCQHQNEPGCAVLHAIESGELDRRRLENYQKLLREEAHNSASIAVKREKDRKFGKLIRSVLQAKNMNKNS